MEASGTPTPSPAQPPASPPPPPPAGPADDERAGGGWRALAIVLMLALLFAGAVMAVAMIDIGDTRTCKIVNTEAREALEQGTAPPTDTECFEGSSTQKTASLVLGWPSAAFAAIAALVALMFAVTGRHGRLLLQLTGAAIALGAISILVGSV
jgi:hypothetical protein